MFCISGLFRFCWHLHVLMQKRLLGLLKSD